MLSHILVTCPKCWEPTTQVDESEDEWKKPCPELTATLPSALLFSWFDSFAWAGFKKPLTKGKRIISCVMHSLPKPLPTQRGRLQNYGCLSAYSGLGTMVPVSLGVQRPLSIAGVDEVGPGVGQDCVGDRNLPDGHCRVSSTYNVIMWALSFSRLPAWLIHPYLYPFICK